MEGEKALLINTKNELEKILFDSVREVKDKIIERKKK